MIMQRTLSRGSDNLIISVKPLNSSQHAYGVVGSPSIEQ